MRVLLQRVTSAAVRVADETVGQIGEGLVLLVGVGHDDGEPEADKLAGKIAGLRIFNDESGRFDRSLLDVGGGVLVVSQFTLYADSRKGRRPSFTDAAQPEQARELFDYFVAKLRGLGINPVETGKFGEHMSVDIHNDGPVTIWLDSDEW